MELKFYSANSKTQPDKINVVIKRYANHTRAQTLFEFSMNKRESTDALDSLLAAIKAADHFSGALRIDR